MDTFNGLYSIVGLRESIVDLKESKFEEEIYIANKAYTAVMAVVEQLQPVMKYVSSPIPYSIRRGVLIGKNPLSGTGWELYLTENGEFLVSKEGRLYREEDLLGLNLNQSRNGRRCGRWTEYPIDFLLVRLRQALSEAKEKREKYLASIAERSEKLDKIMEIVRTGEDWSCHCSLF